MSRFRVLCGVAILILLTLVVVAVGGLAGSATATSAKPPAPSPVHQSFDISQTYLSGSPAIQPRASLSTSGPAFTKNDVIAFFQKNGFFAGPVVEGAHLQILTIQFVSAKQASEMMDGESVGRPDDYLVCYVKVQGPFLLTNVHKPNSANSPTTAQYGDAVFDASTGNLLVWGIYFQ
jgi:hypothetical protein